MAIYNFSEKAKAVYNAVKRANDAGMLVTAADIADETQTDIRSVNGIVTGTFTNQNLMRRVLKKVQVGEEIKKLFFIELTDKGRKVDVNAQ